LLSKQKTPPIKIKIDVPKLTSSSSLTRIKLAHIDQSSPESIPKISAKELGKKVTFV
jgi:hypothetical protein